MLVFLLPILSSMSFGWNTILVRRGTVLARSSVGVLITVLAAPPFFLMLALAIGDLGRLGQLAGVTWGLLVAAGILHFSVGRSLNYRSVQLIGASRAATLSGISPLISMFLAMALFGERLTPGIVLGSLSIVMGAILMMHTASNPGGVAALANPAVLRRGVLLGVSAAVFWAITPILIKAAMNQTSAPVLGILISYTAAALVLGSSLASAGPRSSLRHSSPRAIQWFLLAGLATNMAQLFRYWALAMLPATLVVPLIRTIPLFTLTFSFLVNRRLESFDRYTIAGAILVVVGAVTLFA